MPGIRSFITWIKLSCLCLLFIPTEAFAQEQDSTAQGDTLQLYLKIKKAAYRHRFTTFLYHSIFVDPAPVKPLPQDTKVRSDDAKESNPYAPLEGQVIRSIEIQVLDPFGHSITDSSVKVSNPFQKVGNKYHRTSRKWVISNLLLFEENDTLDLLRVSESERLLRSTSYINDARIYVYGDSVAGDSVDIIVMVHDRWTVDAPLVLTLTGGRITLRERNFGGLGQTFEQHLGYQIPSKYYELRGRFRVNNLQQTYISSDYFYTYTRDLKLVGFSFDRPFYSPLAKWAGGITMYQSWGTFFYYDTSLAGENRTPLNSFNFDTWVAKSYLPPAGKQKNRRITNIIVALRYAGTRHQERPSFLLDSNRFTADRSLYLGSLGFSLAKYYKDRYIFRFGANEDVPEGLLVQLLYGVLKKEFQPIQFYAGVELSKGRHFKKLGYVSAYAVYGTLYNSFSRHNSTLNTGFTYFSNLIVKRQWLFRQFIYLKYIRGFNKPLTERITIRPEEMYGFNSGLLSGTEKAILNFETVVYAPYNFFGFKFAPLLLAGFGVINSGNMPLDRPPVYQSYATGLLIRNENLLTASFEVTFGMYPRLAEGTSTYVRFNPVTSFTLKIRSFTTGKPNVVGYE